MRTQDTRKRMWASAPALLVWAIALSVPVGCGPTGGNLPLVGGGDNEGTPSDPATGGGSDNTSDNDDDPVGDEGLRITGRIAPSATAKSRAAMQGIDPAYVVAVQSVETKETYRAETDADGAFAVDLPPEEAGNAMTVVILDDNGRVVGPVVFDQAGSEGFMAIEMTGSGDLGEVELPDDPSREPIEPGADADVGQMVAPDVVARLGNDGAPVGVGSLGKGDDAMGPASSDPRQALDRDRDGLPDFVDADNDGNGIVDDFDPGDADVGPGDGVIFNCFMNLKISEERADVYYDGSAGEIDAALRTDTVITLEVMADPMGSKAIVSASVVPSGSPGYLPSCSVMTDSDHGLVFTPWADSGYAFSPAGGRFQAFVVPNAEIDAGDSFTVEVTFDDATVKRYSRMINFVFKNIPQLEQHGAPGALAPYAGGQPIAFDGAGDLVLEFRPPVDETGTPLTGLDYHFEFFFNEALGGGQVHNIDGAATWPTPIPNFQVHGAAFYVAQASTLTLSAAGTYTVTLPKELFVDAVTTTDAGTIDIGSYKIDIAAQSNGNNAAIMLMFEKL